METAEIPVKQFRQLAFEELYEQAFPPVAGFVSKMNGSLDDAKDIFHDALVIYYEKISDRKLDIRNEPSAYILGIAKHLWVRKFRQDQRNVHWSEYENKIELPQEEALCPDDQRLMRFLERTGKKCMELMSAFYFEGLSFRKIAQRFGFATEHAATVQKFKCIEKVRDIVKQKSMTYEDFLN
jgi:RNA polymerase sigma factor (sigma-70 family)